MMEFVKFYRWHSAPEARGAYCLRLLRQLGTQEGSADHQKILDDYNSLAKTAAGLPRGHKAVKSDDWCAIFAAGQAHAQGLTKIYPMECSCSRIIEIAKNMGIWIEDDGYIPMAGDWILFAWKGADGEENTLAPNHIGIVYGTDGSNIYVVEGNKGDKVDTRFLQVGDRRIRGYVHPDYSQLIGGLIAPEATAAVPAAVVYHKIEDVPEYARATVSALVERGYLQGIAEGDLGLMDDLLRTLVILDRAGAFSRPA